MSPFRPARTAVLAAAVAATLAACSSVIPDTPGDTAAYPEFTVGETQDTRNPLLTDPGSVLAVGEDAVIGYHTLTLDDSGRAVPSEEEQLIRVTITGTSASSLSSVPRSFRQTGADADAGPVSVIQVTWEAVKVGDSVISMASNGLDFGTGLNGSYIASDPTAISGCSGPVALGSGFDTGATVHGCFLVIYLQSTGAPPIELSVARTDLESDPITWLP